MCNQEILIGNIGRGLNNELNDPFKDVMKHELLNPKLNFFEDLMVAYHHFNTKITLDVTLDDT